MPEEESRKYFCQASIHSPAGAKGLLGDNACRSLENKWILQNDALHSLLPAGPGGIVPPGLALRIWKEHSN